MIGGADGRCLPTPDSRMPSTLRISHPSFSGRIGVARREITPPVGIYCRMWGSASHDVAEEVHRPLTATALTFGMDGPPLVLVALDLGWWRTVEDERFIRGPVLEAFSLDPSRLMINLSHTHAGPCTSLSAADKPGGEKIEPYMRQVRQAVIDSIGEALDRAVPAMLDWSTGRCELATNRQLPEPASGRIVIGYNPDKPADDTVLVGRVSDAAGRVVATIVNYACHPTTLGGGNRLISPDYPGAMRQVVERATGGAPCLYLHGAAGELSPRWQYAADVVFADQNGRQLGHAAVSALEGMLPPGKALAFAGVERSGTDLGRWEPQNHPSSTALEAATFDLNLPLKELPAAQELADQRRECQDRVMAERLERAAMLRTRIGDSDTLPLPVWLWRIGDALLLGTPAEAHSPLQTELRHQFPRNAVAVMNIVNGYTSYIPPREDYSLNSYQSQVALYQPGCLETLIEACAKAIDQVRDRVK